MNTIVVGLDDYRHQLAHNLQVCGIPRHMWESIVEYIVRGRPVGDFLEAVLSNNFMEAATQADALNLPRLPDYAQFLHNHAPVGCFGSPAAYNQWLRTGGVLGRQRATEAAYRDVGDLPPVE